MNLYITVCATESYTYALVAQARRVVACILQAPAVTTGVVVLAGDRSKSLDDAAALYEKILPPGWTVKQIVESWEDKLENYKPDAQRVIAQMRSAAFDAARAANPRADACWSLDSDVLPPPHALQVMLQGLEFSDRYYSISTCPYPSQGGGDFLGGRGTPERPILPDAYEDEHIFSDELRARIEAHETLVKDGRKPDEEWRKEHEEITKEIGKAPRKGDTFFLNSITGVNPFVAELKKRIAATLPEDSLLTEKLHKVIDKEAEYWKPRGFRRRGWHSSAFPAIGAGALLPVDWCGFGCTLMSARALALAQFDGYGGQGTEDLYVVWKRWHRAALRINCIPHAPCDHVIRDRDPKKAGQFLLLQAFHEGRSEECVGHLRFETRAWYQQSIGEPRTPADAEADAAG